MAWLETMSTKNPQGLPATCVDLTELDYSKLVEKCLGMNNHFAFPLFRAISKKVRDIDGPLAEKSPTSSTERLVSRRGWLLSNHSSEERSI